MWWSEWPMPCSAAAPSLPPSLTQLPAKHAVMKYCSSGRRSSVPSRSVLQRSSERGVDHSESTWALAKPLASPSSTPRPPPPAPKPRRKQGTRGRWGLGHALPTGLCDFVRHWSLISLEVSLCAEELKLEEEDGCRRTRESRPITLSLMPPTRADRRKPALRFRVVRDAAARGHELPRNGILGCSGSLSPAVSAARQAFLSNPLLSCVCEGSQSCKVIWR